ncbi:hypothetical protein Tco_0868537 [Tanacetum coccineum]
MGSEPALLLQSSSFPSTRYGSVVGSCCVIHLVLLLSYALRKMFDMLLLLEHFPIEKIKGENRGIHAPVYAPSFVSAPSFDKAMKGQGIQESNDELVRVLERGSLNCGGDRVLVGCVKDFKTLPNIHNVCPSEALILDRHIFDHKPILLKESHMDYGPTPFRFFHYWFLEQDLVLVVEDSWNNDGEIRDSDRQILHDSLLEIDSRLDKGDGRPTDAINRIRIFHDIGVSDNKISIDLAKKIRLNGLLSETRTLSSFMVKFNRLFNLELHKDVSVAHKLQDVDPVSSFHRCPRGSIEEFQLQDLSQFLSSMVLSSSYDRWSWT